MRWERVPTSPLVDDYDPPQHIGDGKPPEVYRARVPGGWLVMTGPCHAIKSPGGVAFVPDIGGLW